MNINSKGWGRGGVIPLHDSKIKSSFIKGNFGGALY